MKYFFALSVLICCQAALPPSFKRCNRKQSDFKNCFSEAVQIGVSQLGQPLKELGLPSMDPMIISSLTMKAGNSAVGFTQKYNNMHISGFSKCDCRGTTMDFKEHVLNAACFCPEIKLDFKYEFDGKLLIIPFSGKGPGVCTMYNVNQTFTFKLEEYVKNGVKHYRATNGVLRLKPENVQSHLANLFGSDKTINDNINKIFNDNWRILYEDVGKNYEEVFGKIILDFINRIFSKVSIAEFWDE